MDYLVWSLIQDIYTNISLVPYTTVLTEKKKKSQEKKKKQQAA